MVHGSNTGEWVAGTPARGPSKHERAPQRRIGSQLVRYDYLTGARNRAFVMEHALNKRGETTRSSAYEAAPFAPPLCECGVDAAGVPIVGGECSPVPAGGAVTEHHEGY